MGFSVRRKPLAQCFLFGVAGLMTGGHATDAHAEPLRVDPALLAPELRETTDDASDGPKRAPVDTPANAAARATDAASGRTGTATAVTPGPTPAPEHPTQLPVQTPAPRRAETPMPPAQPTPMPMSAPSPVSASAPAPAVSTTPAAPATPAVSTASGDATRPTPTKGSGVSTTSGASRVSEASRASAMAAVAPAPGPAALPRVDPALLETPSSAAVELASPASPAEPARPSALSAPAASSMASAPSASETVRADVQAAPVIQTSPALPTDFPAPASAAPAVSDPTDAPNVAAASSATPIAGRRARAQEDKRGWFERAWAPVSNAYHNGTLELYLPFLTHHLRSQYSAEKIASYQEKPLGFGIGSGLYNEKGNWEGVYAMAFQDSHFKPMYMAGYGWQAIWRPLQDTRVGLGYAAGLMSRSDIWGYKPFPVVLPVGSLAYRNFSLNGTFVPGGRGWGNVAFFWAKWEFGKPGERIGTPAQPTQSAQSDASGRADTHLVPSAMQEHRRVPYGPVVTGAAGHDSRENVQGLQGVQGGAQNRRDAVAGAASRMPWRDGGGASGASGTASAPASAAGLADVVGSAGSADSWAGAAADADVRSAADASPALALRRSTAVSSADSVASAEGDARPAFLSAQRVGGDAEREMSAEGDAELRKAGAVVNADRMTYWPVEDEVEAEGQVRLTQKQDVVTGPKMRLRLEDQVGFFETPEFRFKRSPQSGAPSAEDVAFAERYLEQRRQSYWGSGFAMPQTTESISAMSSQGQTMSDVRGAAGRIDFEGENQYRLSDSLFTTCAPGDDSWYLRSNELKLDYDYEQGESRESTLYFKGAPILYWPKLWFSLNRQRKSGVLTPSFSTNSTNGVTLSVPYYWNIAPNRDATITTRLMSKRGVQFDVLGRYLDTAWGGRYEGEGRVEFLPGDRQYDGQNRYGIALSHRQFTGNGFVGEINYNRVSDDDYFTDLSSHVTATSQSQLLQQAKVSYYGGGWWNATVDFQGYQTLQPDANNPVLEQYRMLPQITLNARKPDLYSADANFLGQFTVFSKPKQIINGVTITAPEGRRLVLYPQLSLPYVRPGWYITPKLGLNIRHYSLSSQTSGAPKSISSTLPVMSLDSGMTFERDSRWFGRDYRQTLEPRLYYVNIPYRNQDAIPIFDTALADFNLAQIFSENQFSGWDRINNANQVTAAVSSRLLEPNSGAEIARATVGQRFYFTRNKVGLSANSIADSDDRQWKKSDFLASFSGQVLPRVYADFATQYNFSDSQLKRLSAGVRYRPEPGKALNVAYRYNRDPSAPVKQIDISGQWPLTGRLYAVGRYNYSFRDDGAALSTVSQRGRLIQSVAGLEYNGGCWVLRGVVQRLALTSEKASTGLFVQLELNDFASIGSNPIDMLRRNIQGYSLINEPINDSIYVH